MKLNRYFSFSSLYIQVDVRIVKADTALATYKGKPIVQKSEFDKVVNELGLGSIPQEQYYTKLLMDIMARNIVDAEIGQSDMKKDPDFKKAAEASAKRFEREYFYVMRQRS